MRSKPLFSLLIGLLLITMLAPLPAHTAHAGGIYRTTFSADGYYLTVELLDDDLAHFELSQEQPADEPIWTSPMVLKTDYPGPSEVQLPSDHVIQTPGMRIEVDPDTLCVTVIDLTQEVLLTTLCPLTTEAELKGLAFTQEGTTDLYGLGEQFQRRGGANLFDQNRSVLNLYGNELASFNGGNVENAQFPILYALGENTDSYALFLDSVYQQFWSFKDDLFTVKVSQTPLHWYLMTGPDLPDLRHDYMELTGFPPVPPKQMFGLWVSEYGYESWDELEAELTALRDADFPVDGFVLDLLWFGGISPKLNSQMGSLAWDETHFPDPQATIAQLRAQYGLGIMTIEEPFVSEGAAGYDEAVAAGVLVRKCGDIHCDPVSMDEWWGRGGMVDWTNPAAAAWWHDNRRQHLITNGVIAHWTDLGEPEDFNEAAWYYGFPEFKRHSHADIHNIYNLLWSQSIWEGYQRNGVERRPFILSRSGTSGSQRYGVAMGSGDIGSNLDSLTTQMDVQMQMSLSGIDYFGADVGGFYRDAARAGATQDEVYTIWLANAALLDVPLRPHAFNVQNLYETSPALTGDVQSNRTNIRLRYELSPYLYTLAHRAYRNGDPVFAPLVYYYQTDPNVRSLGSQKMIGPDLMMAAVTSNTSATVQVYLPAGGWYNYYTNDYFDSRGEWFKLPVTVDGVFRVPLLVRAGAVIPVMDVDEQTLNMLGQRADGSTDNRLILKVYGTQQEDRLTLVEDDGETIAYQSGAVRETTITHSGAVVEIAPAVGMYANAPQQRPVEIRLIGGEGTITGVTLNGEQGEIENKGGIIFVKTGAMDVSTVQRVVFTSATEEK